MEQHVRDLGSAELWDNSLERSSMRQLAAHDAGAALPAKPGFPAVTAAML